MTVEMCGLIWFVVRGPPAILLFMQSLMRAASAILRCTCINLSHLFQRLRKPSLDNGSRNRRLSGSLKKGLSNHYDPWEFWKPIFCG